MTKYGGVLAKMSNNIDRYFLGFDRLFEEMDNWNSCKPQSYPPYNIIKLDGGYVVEMTVAGFQKNDISVHEEDIQNKRTLVIIGEQSKEYKDEAKYIHRGLSKREFRKHFILENNLEVSKVNLKDGILEIHLKEIEQKKNVVMYDIT